MLEEKRSDMKREKTVQVEDINNPRLLDPYSSHVREWISSEEMSSCTNLRDLFKRVKNMIQFKLLGFL